MHDARCTMHDALPIAIGSMINKSQVNYHAVEYK